MDIPLVPTGLESVDMKLRSRKDRWMDGRKMTVDRSYVGRQRCISKVDMKVNKRQKNRMNQK